MGVDGPLSVAFVTGDPGSSSARVRVLDRLPGLAAHGVTGELLALPRGWLARRRFFGGLAAHDVVVLARRLVGEGDLVALRRAARALVLDLDDAVWTRPFGRPDRRAAVRFADAARAADLVVVGSAALRDEVRSRHGHPRVRVVPPASPLPASVVRPPAEPGLLRLVWTGSRSTLPYLEALGPLLETLAGELTLRLEVVADARPALPRSLPFTFTPWSLEAEDAALARADVGLYPLAGDAWSRGKCAYKVRRYMAFGLPTIASRSGGGLETLDPPEAGLVADDEGEWLRALRLLAGDPALRQRMCARARALALTRDAPDDRAQTLARILREAAAIGRARSNRGLLSSAAP